MVNTEEAAEMRATSDPTADVLSPKDIEDALLLVLAGPIAENLHCSVNPQDYPEEFAPAYDRLLDLPDTSPLVALDDDLRLTAMQDLIIDLLDATNEDLRDALLEVLAQRHVLTPTVMQALIEHPGRRTTTQQTSAEAHGMGRGCTSEISVARHRAEAP